MRATVTPAPISTPANDLGRRHGVAIPPKPSYPRSFEQLTTEAQQLANRHPEIMRMEDLGPTQTGAARMWAVVFGDPATAGRRVLHLSGLHARELAQPEALMRWTTRTAEALAAGDPVATAWLAGTSIAVIVNANPDGYSRVLAGFDQQDEQAIWHRGNGRAGTPVDLNRNFPTGWDVLEDKLGTPYYKGPSPSSEGETQNIMRFSRAFRPTEAYDWHSPGQVIFPAKITPGEPTNDTDISMRAAQRVAAELGYSVQRSEKQRSGKTGGTFKDWVHAELGALSMTVETGKSHQQPDAEFADTWQRASRTLDSIAAQSPA